MHRKTFILIWVSIILLFKLLPSAYCEEPIFVEKKGFDSEIERLNGSILTIKKSTDQLQKADIEHRQRIESLQKTIEAKEGSINKSISSVKRETQNQIAGIGTQMSIRNIMLIASIVCLLMFVVVLYVIMRKRLSQSTDQLRENITNMRQLLDKESMKVDSRLIEILETQLKVTKENRPVVEMEPSEIDHSLALRVGEEIHRMRKRINNMPEDTKGLGALRNSLLRLEDQFNAGGYEIIDWQGKSWNDGLNISARFIPSDELKTGENIITKVIRPQINFRGVTLKEAEVEVSTGG